MAATLIFYMKQAIFSLLLLCLCAHTQAQSDSLLAILQAQHSGLEFRLSYEKTPAFTKTEKRFCCQNMTL